MLQSTHRGTRHTVRRVNTINVLVLVCCADLCDSRPRFRDDGENLLFGSGSESRVPPLRNEDGAGETWDGMMR